MKVVKFFAGIVVTVIIVLLMFSVVYNTANRWDKHTWETIQYKVQPGDSLWKLSETFCPEDVDKRDWITNVQNLNGFSTSLLAVGQTIEIYVAWAD